MDTKKSLNQDTKENLEYIDSHTLPGLIHETGYPEEYYELMGNFLFINPNYKNIPIKQPIDSEVISNTNRPYNSEFPRPYYNQFGYPYNPNPYGYYPHYYPYYTYPIYGFNPLPLFLLGSIIR